MRQRGEPTTGRLFFGLGLMLLGAALLLERLGLLGHDVMRGLWPLVLLAAGLWRLTAPGCRASGVWLLAAGLLLLLHLEHLASLRSTWPGFVVAGGAAMIVEALDRRRPRVDEGM